MVAVVDEMRTVLKPWGREVIFAETDQYVGKLIFISAGHRLSRQYHRLKDETILVQVGELELELSCKGASRVLRMLPSETQHIAAGVVHRMTAITDVELVEVSTPQLDDVVRLADDYGREGTSGA
jgi:mannose-6-phosphate isomerase